MIKNNRISCIGYEKFNNYTHIFLGQELSQRLIKYDKGKKSVKKVLFEVRCEAAKMYYTLANLKTLQACIYYERCYGRTDGKAI